MAVAKKPARKPGATKTVVAKRVPKSSATKKTAASKNGAGKVKAILPGSTDFDEKVTTGRGKPDVVSPELNPILDDAVKKGLPGFQLKAGDPFSVAQVRRWSALVNNSGRLGDLWVRVSGGRDGKNIDISLIEVVD